jgi:transcriptional regulator with XRE-family HTH domain
MTVTGTMTVRDLGALCSYLRLAGLSQRGLAVRAGIAPATVNHLLSGRRTSCSPGTAAAIERALQCPPGLFFAPGAAQSRGRAGVLAAGTSRR